MRIPSVLRHAGTAIAILATLHSPLCAADDVAAVLEEIRTKRNVPALAAAAIKDGKIVALGATGLRKLGGKEKVTTEDLWHIGSCTKSMTASVAAMLVERGTLKWDQTIGATISNRCPDMEAAWKDVKLEQLLGHRAGAPSKAPPVLWADAWKMRGSPSSQRWTFVRGLLQAAPENPPGSKFAYSNQGYSIAGQMMEAAAKKPWETLMEEHLFRPLQMKSAGFGAPGKANKVDQPWGHRSGNAIPPGPQADNPPSIGPGGTVHLNISDFARYAGWHAARRELLKPEQFTKLHTPLESQDYAMGWHVTERPWGKGKVLTHNGTNTMNFAVMWIAPERNFAVVAATNAGDGEAEKSCDDACAQLIQRILTAE